MRTSTWRAAACAALLTAALAGPLGAQPGEALSDVVFCRAGGVALTLDAYLPQAQAGAAPAVVYVHGGGWRGGDKAAISRWPVLPRLRERGYAVFSVNYRLAPDFVFPAMIEDVKCAVRHLRANAAGYGVDPARIGAWGTSAGGHLVALLGTLDPGALEGDGGFEGFSICVQAVVDMYGPADLPAMLDNARSQAQLMQTVFGAGPEEVDVFERASPVHWVTPGDAPVLMVHGELDATVPLSQSEAFLDALRGAGVPAELVVVDNAGHGFGARNGPISPDLDQISRAVADFFDAWLRAP